MAYGAETGSRRKLGTAPSLKKLKREPINAQYGSGLRAEHRAIGGGLRILPSEVVCGGRWRAHLRKAKTGVGLRRKANRLRLEKRKFSERGCSSLAENS